MSADEIARVLDELLGAHAEYARLRSLKAVRLDRVQFAGEELQRAFAAFKDALTAEASQR